MTGDYHEFSTVSEAPDTGASLLGQRLIFSPSATQSGFITLPSECSPHLISHVHVESYAEGEFSHRGHEETGLSQKIPRGYRREAGEAVAMSPTGTEGCQHVPFQPTMRVTPEAGTPDTPDGAGIEVLVPHGTNPDTADPRRISVTLPEGMGLNPAAAAGLGACTDGQFGVGGEDGRLVTDGSGRFNEENGERTEEPPPPPACPGASMIGNFEVQSPDLPTEACKVAGRTLEECPQQQEREGTLLEGPVYLGAPL